MGGTELDSGLVETDVLPVGSDGPFSFPSPLSNIRYGFVSA